MHTTFETAREKLEKVEFSLPSFSRDKAKPDTEIAITSESTMCPDVTIIEDLAIHKQFIEDSQPQNRNLISSVTITEITSTCEATENNFVVDMEISFTGSLGAKTLQWNTGYNSFAYPYFLAITTPDGQLLAKEVFGLTLSYAPGQTEATKTESLRQLIPLAGSIDSLPKLLVGFQLTEDQLAYNKASISGAGAFPADETYPAIQPQALPVKKPVDAARSAQSAAAGAKVAPMRKPIPAKPAIENVAPPIENVAPAPTAPAPQPEETMPIVIQPATDLAPQPEAVPVEKVIMEDIPPPELELIQPGEPISLQPDPALLQPAQPTGTIE